jgi:replication factor A1
MRNKVSIAEYLYFLSVKYEVGFDRLFKGLASARENHEVSCGKLLIQCRLKARKYDVFLITNGYQVVSQFFVPKYFLDQPNNLVEPTGGHLFRRVSEPKADDGPKHIRDLKCGMKRVGLRARVLNVPKAVLVFTRFGEYARVSNALIADETGAIKLCLWNEKINLVSVNSVVQIENASVTKFHGENQLRLGKRGRLSVIENASFPSLAEAEKGSSEMWLDIKK